MTRFNNNNNESSLTTMVTTDLAPSSSSSSLTPTTTNVAVTLETQSSSSTTATTATTTTKASTTMEMIEMPKVSLIGQPCGHHGSYTFYKAFKYCTKQNKLERVLMLGEFFFVRISPNDDPCIGELQLLWEDHQNHQLLSSTRLYFLPEQTPEGRLAHHGEHEVLAAQDKVILKLTDLVSWITHSVDWIAGIQYKWHPSSKSSKSCSSSTSDDVKHPFLLSSTKLNEEDNVVKDGGENSSETQQQPSSKWLQQRKKLSSFAFIHNQNVIPPNGSVPFLTSQRYITDSCKILFNPPTTSPTAIQQQHKGDGGTIKDNNNIDEKTLATTDPPRHEPKRYCRSFTCSRVDFSDIIPLKLKSNEQQDDLSNVAVLPYNRYCRYRNLLKRIEGREEDFLFGNRIVQDALTELGIPQQRNNHVNILFCRDTFNHEALLNNDLNCDHLAPKLKGRPRKRPLKPIRASSPDSNCSEDNRRMFSPRRTRRTTAASTLASNLLNQSLFDKRKKKKKNKACKTNNLQRSNKNNSDQDQNDHDGNKNSKDGLVMVQFNNKNSNDNQDNHRDDGHKIIDKENKPSNTNSNNNNGNINISNNDDGDGQHCDGNGSEGDKNKTDSVDANNNIDQYKEDEDIIIVVDRKDVATNLGAEGRRGGEGDPDPDDHINLDGKTFLRELMEFMKKRNTPIQRVPNLGFKKIDLYLFYTQAKKYGGYEQLTKKRLWKKLYNEMGGDKRSTSAATCTRRHYEKLLLPYERHLNGLPDLARTRRKRKSSEDLIEESDDVYGVEDELSSNFSETDSSSKDIDSDGRSVGQKSREEEEEAKTDDEPTMVVEDAEVILKRTISSSSNIINKDIMDVNVGNNVNHSPTDQEIDVKLIPIDSGDGCLKKEKELKLFRELSPNNVSLNENILLTVSEDKPNKEVVGDHHQPTKRFKLNNDVGDDDDDDEQCVMMQSSPPTINQTLLNRTIISQERFIPSTTPTTVPFFNSNSHQKVTALVHPTQRRLLNEDVYDFSDINNTKQQNKELFLLKSFESKKQNMNPDHKSRSKGPSPFHSIDNLVNNNNQDRVHSAETVKQGEKTIETTGSNSTNINIGLDNNPTTVPATSANVKKNILQKSLENPSHHRHHQHTNHRSNLMETKPRIDPPLPAHIRNILAESDRCCSIENNFAIQPDGILDLSVRKSFHEENRKTYLNEIYQKHSLCKPSNTGRDGILLDLSSTKNNPKLNSKKPKLPVTSKVFLQENACFLSTLPPAANLNSKKNSNRPPKNELQPSTVSLNSDEMIVRPLEAPQKRCSYKASPKSIKTKATNNSKTSVNHAPESLQPSLHQKPLISDYNPQLPQFIQFENFWSPFFMQTPPSPFTSGVVPPTPVHHSPPKSTPSPQLSFNTINSNMPHSYISSFPNHDPRSSSSSSAAITNNSLSLDPTYLSMLEQIRKLQSYDSKNETFYDTIPFMNPNQLGPLNRNLMLAAMSSPSK